MQGSSRGGAITDGRLVAQIYYLDITLRDRDAERARRILGELGDMRDGKGVRTGTWTLDYTHFEDREADSWKVEYIDFEDRRTALTALARDLDRIDPDWRDCFEIG